MKTVKVGRYYVTPHAQNQMALRDIYTGEVVENLCRKPVARTEIKKDSKGRPGYQRYSDTIMTAVNPENKKVATVRGYHDDEAKKMGITNHHGYVKQSEIDAKRTKSKSVKKASTTTKKSGTRPTSASKTRSTSAKSPRRSTSGGRRTSGTRRR